MKNRIILSLMLQASSPLLANYRKSDKSWQLCLQLERAGFESSGAHCLKYRTITSHYETFSKKYAALKRLIPTKSYIKEVEAIENDASKEAEIFCSKNSSDHAYVSSYDALEDCVMKQYFLLFEKKSNRRLKTWCESLCYKTWHKLTPFDADECLYHCKEYSDENSGVEKD